MVRHAVPPLLLALALAAPTAAEAPLPGSYERAIGGLVGRLLAALPEPGAARPDRLALGWFICGTADAAEVRFQGPLGTVLAGDIERHILEAGHFEVVTREDMAALLREKRDFWESDVVAGASVPRPGAKFLAAAFVLRGKYYLDPVRDRARVTAEIVEIATARKRAAASVSLALSDLPVTPNLDELGLAQQLGSHLKPLAEAVASTDEGEAAASPAAPLRVRVWPKDIKATYAAGETLRLCVTVDRDAYVRLLNVRSDGRVTMLFPNAYHRDCLVRGGQVVDLPTPAMPFTFVIEPPYGLEAVVAVATTSRVQAEAMGTRGFAPPEDGATRSPFQSARGDAKALAEVIGQARGIGVRAQEPAPAWAEARWVLRTHTCRGSGDEEHREP